MLPSPVSARRALIQSSAAMAVCLAAMLWAPAARADCVDGTREATAAEIDFAQRARAALIASMPPLAAPIQRRSKQPLAPGEKPSFGFCRQTPVGAFSPSVSDALMAEFSAAQAQDRSQRRRELLRQIELLEQLPPEKESQRKALEEQMRAAYAATPTRRRSDPPFTPEQQAQVDKHQAEGRRLESTARQVASDHRHSLKPQTEPLREQADKLQQGPELFTIRLVMNAERFDTARDGAVLTHFGQPSPRRSAALRPLNISVSIEGPDGPARRALVDALDRGHLQSLIDKPLPDVAASTARIAQLAAVVPAPVPSVVDGQAASGSAAAPVATVAAPAVRAATANPPASNASPPANCPPAPRTAAADGPRGAAQAGAEVGGAVLGGGWGRQVGGAVGGVLGALGGAKKPTPAASAAAADCPPISTAR